MLKSVPEALNRLLNGLPTLSKHKNANWACAIGFFTGGIGLAIYFRSFIDLMIPIALAIVTTLVIYKLIGAGVGIGTIGGATISALYGYFRVLNSNNRLEAPAGIPATPVPPG